jgi:hypothetical protein
MDFSGRFNFWRVLVHTRAITPPRVTRWFAQSVATLTVGNWAWLLVGVAMLVAIALRFAIPSQPADSRAEPAPSPAPANVSTNRPPW